MTILSDLNDQHAIAQQLQFVTGAGGLPVACINNQHATATIALLGGQILTYRPHGAQPVLWVSDKADYAIGKAIRGGVPIIFPWFGKHPKLAQLPSHGLVRSRLWQVVASNALADGATQLVLSIKDDHDTRALWPYTFRAEVTITVGEVVTVALEVVNTGVRPMRWSGALHSYFCVGNSAETVVDGLDGVTYQDKLRGDEALQEGAVAFAGEIDRVYLTDAAESTLVDGAWQRTISVKHGGHDSVVVWNPGKTAVKHDLTKLGYTQFVCVETGVGAGVVSAETLPLLAPNQSHTVTTTIRV